MNPFTLPRSLLWEGTLSWSWPGEGYPSQVLGQGYPLSQGGQSTPTPRTRHGQGRIQCGRYVSWVFMQEDFLVDLVQGQQVYVAGKIEWVHTGRQCKWSPLPSGKEPRTPPLVDRHTCEKSTFPSFGWGRSKGLIVTPSLRKGFR